MERLLNVKTPSRFGHVECGAQLEHFKTENTFCGKVDVKVPDSGLTSCCVSYPAGKYRLLSSEHWGVGIVRKPFDVHYCAFGSASCGRRDILASQVIVSEPRAEFDAKLTSETEIEYILMSKERFASGLPDHTKTIQRLKDGRSISFSSPLLAELVNSAIKRLHLSGCSTDHYLDALADAIIAYLTAGSTPSTGTRFEDSRLLSSDALEKIDTFINDNLSAKISLDALAQKAGANISTFRNAFKAKTGRTPYQYILDARVDRAQTMLRTSHLAMAKIAFDCGFSSQSHMTDVFRQRLGTTPKAVRFAS